MAEAKYKSIDPQDLHDVLEVDVATGRLLWKRRTIDMCSSDRYMRAFNSAYAGKEALTTPSGGYRIGTLFGIAAVKAHHVVFAMVHGRWPYAVDHQDGDPGNNRPGNLVEKPQSENNKNMRMRYDNPTGHVGVRRSGRGRGWSARIGHDGQSKYLGTFACVTAAAIARKRAERELGYHANHGRKTNT